VSQLLPARKSVILWCSATATSLPGKLFICTEESYRKTVVEGRAVKVTAYEYAKLQT
jgi:hypothetical protein